MARSHLWEVKRGYWSHASHALGLSFRLIHLGLTGMVHAFIPSAYRTTMSTGVDKIKHLIWKDKQRVRLTKR